MTDSSGFYKLNGGGAILYAPNAVYGPGYTLTRATHEATPAFAGWQWYETLDAAQAGMSFGAEARAQLEAVIASLGGEETPP